MLPLKIRDKMRMSLSPLLFTFILEILVQVGKGKKGLSQMI